MKVFLNGGGNTFKLLMGIKESNCFNKLKDYVYCDVDNFKMLGKSSYYVFEDGNKVKIDIE